MGRRTTTDSHLIDFSPLGFVGAEVNAFRHYGIFPLLEVGQPVACGLVGVGAMGSSCRRILAGVHNVMVIETCRAAPEVQFLEVVVLLPSLAGQSNAAADLLGEGRRQINDRVITIAVVVLVRAMGIEDNVHAGLHEG